MNYVCHQHKINVKNYVWVLLLSIVISGGTKEVYIRPESERERERERERVAVHQTRNYEV